MIGIGARTWTNEFNRYVALQPFVSRPENLTHGSGPDFLKNSIVTYDPAIHAQRSAGMLGCVSFAVNNRMQSAVEYGTLRTTRRSLPWSASRLLSRPTEGPVSCYNFVSPADYQAACDSLYQANLAPIKIDTRSSHVWPFKMGHNQAQEGRPRRQARQDFYPYYQGNQNCREEWGRGPRVQSPPAGLHWRRLRGEYGFP